MAAQKQYELVYIASPDATEEQLTELQALVEGIITKANGTIDKADVWGRRRLAARVSPAKSWEGVVGGTLAALAWTLTAALVAGLPPARWPALLLVAAGTVAASVLGDLTESLFKREAGVKDSGDLLPGHGGVLDRIDSLTAAAPVFLLLVRWAGGLP